MSVTTVVVADDHPMVLRGIMDFLRTEPDISVVASCSSGTRALERIRALQPAVALLDLSMPNMNGLEVLVAINYHKLATRVLFLAAVASSRDVIAAMAEGAYGFLQKDSQPAQLLHCIREIAAGRKCIPFKLLARAREDASVLEPVPVEKLLTQREWKIMALAAEGHSNKEIAQKLKITTGTAKIHLHHIFRKVGVKNRTALASLALRQSGHEGTAW